MPVFAYCRWVVCSGQGMGQDCSQECRERGGSSLRETRMKGGHRGLWCFSSQVTITREEAPLPWQRPNICLPLGSPRELPSGVSVAQSVSAFGC